MAGKSKKERKKAAKTRKREKELLREKKPKKILAEETVEPAPEHMLAQQLEDEAKIEASEAEELAHAGKQAESEAKALEPEPFDPASVVANILKKKE